MLKKVKLQRRIAKLEAKGIHGVRYQIEDFVDLINETRIGVPELKHEADEADTALQRLQRTAARTLEKPALGKQAHAALKDLGSAMEHFRKATDTLKKVAKKAR